MQRFVVFVLMALTSVAFVVGQQNSAILSDSRYLSNNGQFGAAYKQGDGSEFKEESDADGNRRGSYSYVDPNGQRRTVHYTAGKDGFKATGDHLPVAPTPVPVPAVPAVPAAKSSPWQDQWSQAPAAAAVPNQWNQWNSAPTPKYDDGQWNQWSSDAASNVNGQWNQWNAQPKSDDGDDGQWRDDSGKWTDDGSKWNQWNAAPAPAPKSDNQWNQWNSIPTTAKWNQWNSAPTAPPSSYSVNQASGKLSLNRSPDGFSYTFSQN